MPGALRSVIAIGILVAASVSCGRQNPTQLRDPRPISHEYSGDGPCAESDARGIPAMQANRQCHERFVKDGRVLLDSTWRTDAYGRRVVPHSNEASDRFVAFLGCSFTFGEAVNDDQSFPAQVARSAKDWAVYNYGIIGAGPNDLLYRLETRSLANEIPQRHGKFVFLWISDHAWRVYGSLAHWFVDIRPRYVLNASGEPEFVGRFNESQPIRYWFFDWLRRIHVGEKLGINIPPRITLADYPLIESIFRKMQKDIADRFPGSEFYIVLFPEPGNPAAHLARDEFRKAFAGSSIQLVDYVDAAFPSDQGPLVLEDGHPSAVAYRILGQRLVQDLGLNRPRRP